MPQVGSQLSPFGRQLRLWRQRRGLSQLELATRAQTTPRHVSFIETGRSRPGRELVLRLAASMDLPVRDRNTLLAAAGLPAAFAEHDLSQEQLRPFRMAVEAVLRRHEPYPACAADGLGRVKLTNAGFRALWPAVEEVTPEQAVDAFFGPGPMRKLIENWAEVAWSYAEGRRHEAARTSNRRLIALAERALRHLEGVPRPTTIPAGGAPVVCPRFRFGDQVIRTFSTVMRFEHPSEVTISELRVELIFPLDEAGDAFFRGLVAGAHGEAGVLGVGERRPR